MARYLYGPGRREEHVDPRVVAGDGVLLGAPRSCRDWAADMAFYARQRPNVARPVWHCSLRTAPEDPVLADAWWAAIAQQHITTMGLAGHPWVAVRHGDNHVHIVACRIDPAGRVWRDGHDYARSMRSCRQLERDHGLTVVTAHRSTGRYATAQVWLKASQVDRRLSWAQVRPGLADPTSGRPPAAQSRAVPRSTAAQIAAQAFATPPAHGRRWAGTPAQRERVTAARLAALDQQPWHRPPLRRARAVVPLHVMVRLVAALKANNADEDIAAALYLVYALAALADAVADLRQAHDWLHQARAAHTAGPPLHAGTRPVGITSTPPTHPSR